VVVDGIRIEIAARPPGKDQALEIVKVHHCSYAVKSRMGMPLLITTIRFPVNWTPWGKYFVFSTGNHHRTNFEIFRAICIIRY
jgi:hypothetical protein